MTDFFDAHDLHETRLLRAAPERAFAAFSDPAAKRAWFCDVSASPDFEVLSHSLDFREDGAETAAFARNALRIDYAARYMLIAPPHHLAYSYAMQADGRVISASLVTVTLTAEGAATRLDYRERVVFIDRGNSLETRLPGTVALLDRLARQLA